MATIWNFILHVAILCSAFGLAGAVYLLVKAAPSVEEIVIRTMACGVGFLVYAAATAMGISIPQLLFSSLQETNFFLAAFSGAIFPAAFGVFVAWICIRALKRGGVFVARLVGLFSVFILIGFVDTYTLSYSVNTKGEMNKLLMPNISFIVGVVMYIIFKVDTSTLTITKTHTP